MNRPNNGARVRVVGAAAEDAIESIRDKYPHGHPRFAEITIGELKLHSNKNHDYAAGGDPLGNFRRVAAFFAQYPGLRLDDPAVVALTYAMKQVDAYLWLKSNGHRAIVEGGEKRLEDVSVYAKLSRILDEEKQIFGGGTD